MGFSSYAVGKKRLPEVSGSEVVIRLRQRVR